MELQSTRMPKYPPEYPTAKLLDESPLEAARRVNAALQEADGLIEAAARKLFVSSRTLRRWIKRLRDQGRKVGPVRAQGSVPGRAGAKGNSWVKRRRETAS